MPQMAGTAPKFAFLHGGGQGGWVWDETLAALAQQNGAAYASTFDLPGCGTKRGIATAGLTVRDVAAVFTQELVDSGMENSVLVGHANAGTILPMVAALRPGLV